MKKIKKEDEFEQLRESITKLEERLQSTIKSHKELEKQLSRHVKQQSAERNAVLQWIQQLSGDKKSRFEAISDTQNEILERHLNELKKDVRKQLKFQKDMLKQEISRVSSVQQELLQVHSVVKQLIEGQQILMSKVDKDDRRQTSQELQQRFSLKIEQGMTNIQNILKNYISDQSVVHLKLKNLEDKINNFTVHRSLANTDRELFELTPRDASLMTSQQISHQISSNMQHSLKNSKENLSDKAKEGQDKYTSYADRNQKQKPQTNKQPLSGYLDKLARSDRKTEEHSEKYSIERNIRDHSETDRVRSNSQMRNKDRSLENDSSTKKIERESSYSSKKIMDLRQKLKQFEQINSKYQKEEAPPTTKNAIQQLKQFKYLLENTESEIDLSNTFNQDLQPNKPLAKERSLPKFKKSKN